MQSKLGFHFQSRGQERQAGKRPMGQEHLATGPALRIIGPLGITFTGVFMRKGLFPLPAFPFFRLGASLAPASHGASANAGIDRPHSTTPLGTFGGIPYVQHDGIFKGRTSTGEFRVPYRITAPADPNRANRSVIVEPPHPFGGLGTLNTFLRPDFLLSRGFVHAGVGWSTTTLGDQGNLRILDPSVQGVFIHGGLVLPGENGRTDDEIVANFARALVVDSNALAMVGSVDRRYLMGFSDSSDPVMRLVAAGGANGAFDLVLPFTADKDLHVDLQTALAGGRYTGKLMVVNSEFEGTSADHVDRGATRDRYRFYAVAGTPHIPDILLADPSNIAAQTTPASWQPELRARFLQADSWVRTGALPPPSNRLKTTDGTNLDRDVAGNAISVDANMINVPRLPFIELHEARFIVPDPGDGRFGRFDAVKTIGDLQFASHTDYSTAFKNKLADYQNAGCILQEDADAMLNRAQLCPPLTFTETYCDHFDAFVAIQAGGCTA